jgi:hypothetical protein
VAVGLASVLAFASVGGCSIGPDRTEMSPPPATALDPVEDDDIVDVAEIVLVGDSLAQEASPYLQWLTAPLPLVPKFWGGTAPCDWIDVDLESGPSSVVVISFTGNSLTPCMQDGDGVQARQDELIVRYRADVTVLVDRSRRSGARVVLVGQPLRAPDFDADREVEGINRIYRDLAARDRYVEFVDAGRDVEAPDGSYTERLPCEELDSDCAPDGTTVVRGDGVHFCPVVDESPCPVWSSGAHRFARAIATVIDTPSDLG